MQYLFFVIVPLLPLQNIIEKIPKGPTGINFQNLMLLSMMGLWIWRSQQQRQPMIRPNPMNVPLALYILLTFLGLWRAAFYLHLDLPVSLSDPHVVFWKDYFTTMCFFWFTMGIIKDEREMRWLLLAMVAITPYMLRVHYNQLQALRHWSYSHDLRVHGVFMFLGSNELAAFYTQYGLLFTTMISGVQERWQKWAFAVGAGICVWGAIYSYSRASYVGLVVGFLIFGFLKSRKLVMALLGFLLIAPAVMPRSVMQRIEMTQSGEGGELDDSAASRLDFWELAWNKFLDHPVMGIGYHSFHHINPVGLDTHNMYVKQLAELGIAGIILFMILYVVQLTVSIRLYKRADTPFLKSLALGVVLCIISNMVLNIFGDRSSYLALATYYWVGLGLVCRGLELVAARRHAPRPGPQGQEPPPPPPPRASIFAQHSQG